MRVKRGMTWWLICGDLITDDWIHSAETRDRTIHFTEGVYRFWRKQYLKEVNRNRRIWGRR